MALSGYHFSRGWYQLEIKLDSFQTLTNSCLVIKYDDREEILNIPLKGGNVAKRTVRILGQPAQIRLELNERIYELDIAFIRFTKLYVWLAKSLMTNRLSFRHIDAHSDMDSLWALYCETYITGNFSSAYNNAYHNWIHDIESGFKPPEYNRDNPPLISLILYSRNHDINNICDTISTFDELKYNNLEVIFECSDTDTIPENIRTKNYLRPIVTSHPEPLFQLLNRCKDTARGDLLIFLEAGSRLSVDSLDYIAACHQSHPEGKIFYSDCDTLDDNGNRVYPRLTPVWNRLYFYSYDYLSGFLIFNAGVCKSIDFRDGREGVELYDYTLCCLDDENITDNTIIHIPYILCHSSEKQTDTEGVPQHVRQTNRLESLRDYLRKKEQATALGIDENGCIRIKYSIEIPPPLVTLIVPTRDNRVFLEKCITSILAKTSYPDYEIIIVNNNSTDEETLAYYSDLSVEKRVRIIDYPYPFNFSAINNYAVRQSTGSIIGLLNDDTEIINPDWLEEMVSYAVQDKIGCVGAKLLYANGNIQHGGVVLGLGDVAGHAHRYFPMDSTGYMNRLNCTQYMSAVTAACLVIRKKVYNEVGGLDEENLTIAYNDVDFCLKVRAAGYYNVWTPHARLYHYESISRGSENTLRKKLRYKNEVEYVHRKWGKVLTEDPYYHPWLTNKREDFSLRFQK